MSHRKTTLAYGVTDDARHAYALEDYSGWSRSHNKAKSIRNWKRDLKSKARQANRRKLHDYMTGNCED